MNETTGSERRSSQSFLHGALILTLGVVAVKVIGAMFKIPLTWLIGEDGLGYFNTAYHLYSPIHSLATAGFPIAISHLVSEAVAQKRFGDGRLLHRVSIPLFVITGTIGTLLMALGAPFYCKLLGNDGALPSMLVLSPAILFGCLMAIYRGYYEGLRYMTPTAVSELLEAVSKLVLGLTSAGLILWLGMAEYGRSGTVFGVAAISESYAKSLLLPYASAGAIFGVTVGSLVGACYLFHKRHDPRCAISEGEAATMSRSLARRRLLRTSLPIGLGALAVNIADLVDTTFLQTQMGYLLSTSGAQLLALYEGQIPELNVTTGTVPNYLYGCYSQALTLFMVVPSVTQTFGISALPNVTTAWAQGDREKLGRSISSVLRLTCLFSIPAGLGLSALSKPIIMLVFGARSSTAITAKTLTILGIASIFAALSTPILSMLQSVGRADLPVKLFLIGLSCKLVIGCTLSTVVSINLLGACIGTLCCYVFLTIAGILLLKRVTKVPIGIGKIAGKPLIGGILSTAAAVLSHDVLARYVGSSVAVLIALVIAVGIYVFSLALLCAIDKSEILMLPNGKKIVKALEKIHIIV